MSTQVLQAGPLSAHYENGALRSVCCEGVEILQAVYAAVRDEHWLSVPCRLTSETVTQTADGFSVRCECRYAQASIDYSAVLSFTGTAAGNLRAEFFGTALEPFRRNRIGLCIHHPSPSLRGKPCEIVHQNGTVEQSQFPGLIAPHQPFLEVQTMRWSPLPGFTARLDFEGDAFETEDQRNWTDASFKTYSTPLVLPYPVEIVQGETVHQRIGLTVSSAAPVLESGTRQLTGAAIFSSGEEPAYYLPPVGVGHTTGGGAEQLLPKEVMALRLLGLSHLRVEAHLTEADWENDFRAGAREAEALGIPLETAAFFSDASVSEVGELLGILREAKVGVKSVLVLSASHKVTPPELAATIFPILRDALPGAALGGGTDANFAEINRNQAAHPGADFLAWSVSPQVHSEDWRSIVENLGALGDTLQTARAFAAGRRLFVSPVTLRRRRNYDATGPMPPRPNGLPWDVDSRQPSLAAAGWLLASITKLAAAGADSLTFFEAAGMRGLLLGENAPAHPAFPASPGTIFPAYYALQAVLSSGTALVVPWAATTPEISVLALRYAAAKDRYSGRILIANHSLEPQSICVPLAPGPASWHILGESGGFSTVETWEKTRIGGVKLQLPPFAVGKLDVGVLRVGE